MKKHFSLPGLLILLALLASACTAEAGSGNVVSNDYSLDGVNAVAVSGIGQVTIEQAGEPLLTITTDDNFADNIIPVVEGGTLKISMRNIANPTELSIRISVPDLNSLRVDDLINVRIAGIQTRNLSIVMDGGSVAAAGAVESLQIETGGTAAFDGTGLDSRSVVVAATGVSDVFVNASQTLQAATGGVATVVYSGSPQVEADTSAGGSIQDREQSRMD